MSDLYRVRHDCRGCRSGRLDLVLPLAPMPIATPNFRTTGADRNSPLFRQAVPLDLHLCRDCGLIQLTHVGNAHVQFENYVYTTSLSLGLTEHFRRASNEICSALALNQGDLVVEFGSNDGTLLKFFKDRGFRVQGCDPAISIANRAAEDGIPTIAGFFGTDVAARIKAEQGPAAVVLANNVIANIDDLEDVLAGVREMLADDGVFVFETQYGLDVIRHNLLDTVYHEHLCYFTVRPLQACFRRFGMEVIDVTRIPTKGGSIRVYAQKIGGRRSVAQKVAELLADEQDAGLYDRDVYARLGARIEAIRNRLHTEIARGRAQGRQTGGYGVSVGATTLIAQFALADKLDAMFDDDPDKDPVMSGPGYDIPVHGPRAVGEINPALLILFAWRYADPILKKHTAWLASGGRAVLPLPDFKLIDAGPS